MFGEIYKVAKILWSIEFLRMSILWTLSLVISHLRLFGQRLWGCKSNKFPRQRVGVMSSGKRPLCIITGATSGLGKAVAKALSKEGFFVILVGRSGQLLSKSMAEIREVNESAQLEAFEVDLASFYSIMKFKNSLELWFADMNFHPSIQLLINNAGILASSYRINVDGFDEMMMTNYIGAFCLTNVLLPLLNNSPVPSRIVNVSSFTHRNVSNMQVNAKFLLGKSSNLKQYPFAQIYECSKLCLLLFSYELHRQICKDKSSRLSVNIADPGVVRTNIMRELPKCLPQLAYSVLQPLRILHFPEQGITSILDAALAPFETSGMYFFGGEGRTLKSSSLSYDTFLAKRLWETSCNVFSELKCRYEKTTMSVS